jgi:redox-regulated HSP33 family molecular chaperone
VLEQVLSAHDYPAPITHLLGEALVLGALMGGLLKGDQAQMTLQAQTNDGIVSLLVCDYRGGAVRGARVRALCAARRRRARAAGRRRQPGDPRIV